MSHCCFVRRLVVNAEGEDDGRPRALGVFIAQNVSPEKHQLMPKCVCNPFHSHRAIVEAEKAEQATLASAKKKEVEFDTTFRQVDPPHAVFST